MAKLIIKQMALKQKYGQLAGKTFIKPSKQKQW